MKDWDDREKDSNYRMPKGRLASAMRILFVGSVALFAFYLAIYVLDWTTFAPSPVP